MTARSSRERPQHLQVVAERGRRASQAKLQPTDLSQAALDAPAEVAVRRSALLGMTEAAFDLGYEGPRAAEAAVRFLRGRGVRVLRRGTRCFVRRDEFTRFIETWASDLERAAAKHAAR